MTSAGGLGSSIGMGAETTYGTYAVPTRWFEFMDENLDFNKVIADAQGIKQGRLVASGNRSVIGTSDGAGDMHIEIPTKGLGLPLSMFMGVNTLTQQAATAAWLQVHTLADLLGKSATIQKGVSSALGVVTPYSFLGCKGSKFDIQASIAKFVTGKFTFDAMDVVTSQAYAAPSYIANPNNFVFSGGAIIAGGAPTFSTTALSTGGTPVAAITDFSLSVDRALETGRYYFNNAGKKAEPINGIPNIAISVKADYIDTTFTAAHLADTSLSVVLTFTGQTIATIYKETLQIVIPLVKFRGELPKVSGPKIVSLSLTGKGYDDGTNSPLYIGYQSSDTAI